MSQFDQWQQYYNNYLKELYTIIQEERNLKLEKPIDYIEFCKFVYKQSSKQYSLWI